MIGHNLISAMLGVSFVMIVHVPIDSIILTIKLPNSPTYPVRPEMSALSNIYNTSFEEYTVDLDRGCI